ncbi:MAG: flippase [Nanoarchaeota archaeon]
MIKDKEEIDKNLKLIAKSSFVILFGLVFSKILTYTYRVIIARNFGPEIYGLFSISTMLFGWFVLFASFGFSEGLLRYIPWYIGKRDYKKINFIFKTSILISIVSGILSGILLFFLAEYISISFFHNKELIIFLKVFSFLIPFFLLNSLFLSVLQSFGKINWYSFIVNIFQNIIKVFAIILLVIISFKTNAIIISYLLSIVFMFFLSYYVCRSSIPGLFERIDITTSEKKKSFLDFFSYSWPLLFSVAMAEIFFWIDSLLIGYFNGVVDVGLYNVAVPIVLFLMITPEIFLKLFFPIITREFSNNKKEVVKQLSQQVGKWIFLLNLPLFLIMFIFPGIMINILFGSQYLSAFNALRILSIGGFISSLTWISYSLLSMAGKSKAIFWNILIASGINILLGIFFIPKYGINGAALSTTLSKFILAIILFSKVKKELNIFPFRKKIIQILLLSLVPTTIVLYLRSIFKINFITLILVGILFILIYLLLIFLTNALDKNDFMVLKSIKNKLLPQIKIKKLFEPLF